jgi:hypothetical protein
MYLSSPHSSTAELVVPSGQGDQEQGTAEEQDTSGFHDHPICRQGLLFPLLLTPNPCSLFASLHVGILCDTRLSRTSDSSV